MLAALEGHGIRLVPVRYEAAGIHMAEDLYKTTGQVAAVRGNLWRTAAERRIVRV